MCYQMMWKLSEVMSRQGFEKKYFALFDGAKNHFPGETEENCENLTQGRDFIFELDTSQTQFRCVLYQCAC